jgi:hypothetical protein
MFGPPKPGGRTIHFLITISRFLACYFQLCSLSFCTIYPMFFAWCSVRCSHNSHVFLMFCYNNRFILFGLPQSSIMLASTMEKWKLFTIGVPFWFWQGLYWHIGCNLDIWYWYEYWYWRRWQFCMSWGNMSLISIPVCFGTWGNTRYIPVLYQYKIKTYLPYTRQKSSLPLIPIRDCMKVQKMYPIPVPARYGRKQNYQYPITRTSLLCSKLYDSPTLILSSPKWKFYVQLTGNYSM